MSWRDDDGSYAADIPDLTYCSAFGDTPREALDALEQARAAWLESARAEGKPSPRPSYRPVIYEAAH
jgi:predicted RNase H-like HicB family nuclease